MRPDPRAFLDDPHIERAIEDQSLLAAIAFPEARRAYWLVVVDETIAELAGLRDEPSGESPQGRRPGLACAVALNVSPILGGLFEELIHNSIVDRRLGAVGIIVRHLNRTALREMARRRPEIAAALR